MAVSDPASVLSARRASPPIGAGLAAGAGVALAGEPELFPIVAWTVATSLTLLGVWRILWPQDPVGTKQLAEAESASHTTDTAVLAASMASLVVVGVALHRSTSTQGAGTTLVVLLGVVSVVLSWALTNTVFALKYARLYYLDEDGGIDFRQPDPPAYCDFAYLAFTVGMTFQVSDTQPANSHVRRVLLGHALLSYIFGTGIVAVAINLVANLAQS